MKKAMVTAEQLNASAWAAALASPLVPDKVPPGWFTLKELAATLGKGRSTMSRLLNDAADAGRCERQNFRVLVGSLRRTTPHYRLK